MITIRRATAADIDDLFRLINAIADHHGQALCANPAQNMHAGFGDDVKFAALLAVHNDMVVGYRAYTTDYSVWLGRDYMRIDDVYVDTSARGNGIIEALMMKSRELCATLGISRINEVQTDNAIAARLLRKARCSLL